MSTRPPPFGGADPGCEHLAFLDGSTAELRAAEDGWTLEVGGVPQSHLGDPAARPRLVSMRWMLAAFGGDHPSSCAHLGGGLLTLPRLIAHRHPGARQVVVELEPALVALTRARLPVPEGVTVLQGDARAWLDDRPVSGMDAVVIDIFAGDRIPPAFTSLECLTAARDILAPDGRLVMNSAAGPDLTFTRRQLATLAEVFEHVAMIVQGSALAGARYGNATLIASPAPMAAAPIRAALSGDPSRGALVTDLDPIIDGAEPLRDADQVWSPDPRLRRVDATAPLLEQARAAVRGRGDVTR